MDKRDICGGIVTFNPEIRKLEENIKILTVQVDTLVIIDNASVNINDVEVLVASFSNTKLIKNNINYGIAKALNQILEYAIKERYAWYLTMDQDSICCIDMIEKYIDAYEHEKDKPAVLCPFVLNNNKISLDEYKRMDLPKIEDVSEPTACISSASLNSVLVAKSIGGYKEELFIDCVDIEFNIRLLYSGNKIIRVNSAYMFQTMGKAKYVPFLGGMYHLTKKENFKRLRYTPVYNDMRLYYIARNSKFIFDRYGEIAGKRMRPKWMIMQYIYYLLTYPLSRNRIKMLKSLRQGIKDAKKIGGKDDFSCNGNI